MTKRSRKGEAASKVRKPPKSAAQRKREEREREARGVAIYRLVLNTVNIGAGLVELGLIRPDQENNLKAQIAALEGLLTHAFDPED